MIMRFAPQPWSSKEAGAVLDRSRRCDSPLGAMSRRRWFSLLGGSLASYCLVPTRGTGAENTAAAQIRFALKSMPFRVETDETPKFPHAPATMAGGVAVFDYNKDGRPDIFFANGANIETLKKDAAKFSNRLFRNDGNGVFTDVTKEAGLAGTGYDMGRAIGDYDNDGFPDLHVAGVHCHILSHNNGDGTFTNVSAKERIDRCKDHKYGPLKA